MPSIRLTFSVLAGLSLVAGLSTCVSVFKLQETSVIEAAAYENRYQSYLLADELRQSSDDLTRLGRVYVATGDASYKDQYLAILDIRNGKRPRPEAYNRIYWDFVAGGVAKPRPDGISIPLLDLMKRQGFTEQELQQLDEAKKNSDGLVGLEVEAMNLVEGKDKNGKPLQAPDRARAIDLVHSKEYHQYKAQIMAPIDRFFVMLDKRTQAAIDASAADAAFWRNILVGSIGALLLFVLALCAYTYRFVVRGLSGVERTTQILSGGNFDTSIDGLARQDEIGSISRALEDFRGRMKQAEAARAAREKELAAQAKAAQRNEEMQRLADQFELAVGEIVGTMAEASGELESAAGILESNAVNTRTLSSQVAVNSDKASENVQSVASAANEMSASVQEIGRQVHESSRISSQAVEQAQSTDLRISELSQAAMRIGDVVKLITAISEQTNLLALNATIEAARAGDAGRGFAVVAQEVKALAAQTGKATGDISSQIAGIQSVTQESVAAIKQIGETIGQIAGIATVIAGAVEEQSAATAEIARNVQEAAHGVTQVAGRINEVQHGASETGTASSKVQTSARKVSSESTRLEQEVKKFLATVRAA